MSVLYKNITHTRIVVAPTPQELRDPTYQLRVRLSVANLGISRRETPNRIAHSVYGFDGIIISTDGEIIKLDDIDEMIGDPRNISNLIEKLPDGSFRRGIRKEILLFIVVIWMKIDYPHIARHFGRQVLRKR